MRLLVGSILGVLLLPLLYVISPISGDSSHCSTLAGATATSACDDALGAATPVYDGRYHPRHPAAHPSPTATAKKSPGSAAKSRINHRHRQHGHVGRSRPAGTGGQSGGQVGGNGGDNGGGQPTKPPSGSTCSSPRFPGDPCGQMYYGASVEGGNPGALENQTGRKLSLFRSYMNANTPSSKFASRASDDIANGRIPLISTKVPGSWASVASGAQDGWLTDIVKSLAKVDGPVWLALHHEPTSDGDPADWVAMQQHARKVIKANSSNVALVGILNGWDFRAKNGNPDAFYMPVGSGVDVMGFDGYNGWSPSNGKKWVPASEVFAPGLAIQKWGYPTLVGEYGVRTDPKDPGKAAQWLRDAYEFAASHNFVGISYFDSGANSPDGTWVLDSERMPAFRQNLNGADTAWLA